MKTKKANRRVKNLKSGKKLQSTKPLTTSLLASCCTGQHIKT
ncbi:MAG TPA: hypothetical protein VLY23_19060 [Candidatus Acidoferrum sp.]|nr:hypothetical protein [Candidatus Acidoferrum sp.]